MRKYIPKSDTAWLMFMLMPTFVWMAIRNILSAFEGRWLWHSILALLELAMVYFLWKFYLEILKEDQERKKYE